MWARSCRRPRTSRVSGRIVPSCGEAAIHPLDLVAHLGPGPGLAAGAAGGAQLIAERGVATEALQLGRQRQHVAEGEEQPTFALADQLAVELQVRDDGNGARGERLPQQAGCGSDAPGRETCDVRSGKELGGLTVSGPHDSETLTQPPADAGQRVGRAIEPDHPLPIEVVGQPAQGSKQEAQRSAFLLRAVHDPHAAGRRRLQGGLGDVRARPDQLVLAREEALEQLSCRLVAGGAGVDAPEEDLHEHPGDLGRQNPLDGLVKGGDVERLRVAERRRAGAGGERLVDVHDVERRRTEQPFEGPAHVQWERRRPATRTARQRNALADRDHAGVLAPPDRLGIGLSLSDQAATLANRLSRVRGRNDQNPVTAPGELLGGAGDELVDLVPLPPGMGRLTCAIARDCRLTDSSLRAGGDCRRAKLSE